MLRTTTLTPMAHLICVAHTRLELAEILVSFRKAGRGEPHGPRRRPPDRPRRRGRRAAARRRARRAGPGHRRLLHRRGRPSRRPPVVARHGERTATSWPPSCAWPTSPSPSSSSRPTSTSASIDDLAARGVDKPVLPGIMPVTAAALGAPHGRRWGRPCRPGPWRAWRRPRRGAATRRCARPGWRMATELCAEAARRRRAGAALLHAQPLERDPRDLRRAAGLSADRHVIAPR